MMEDSAIWIPDNTASLYTLQEVFSECQSDTVPCTVLGCRLVDKVENLVSFPVQFIAYWGILTLHKEIPTYK